MTTEAVEIASLRSDRRGVRDAYGVTTPDSSATPAPAPSIPIVFALAPQILVSVSLAWYVWVFSTVLSSDACSSQCDYDLAFAANIALWIALGLITVVTTVGLVEQRRRGRPTWPMVLAGIAVVLLVAFVADRVITSAY